MFRNYNLLFTFHAVSGVAAMSVDFWTGFRWILGGVLGLDPHRARCLISPNTKFRRLDDGFLEGSDLVELSRRIAAGVGVEAVPVALLEQSVDEYVGELQTFFEERGLSINEVCARLRTSYEGIQKDDPFLSGMTREENPTF
jgi:hypothetical protein